MPLRHNIYIYIYVFIQREPCNLSLSLILAGFFKKIIIIIVCRAKNEQDSAVQQIRCDLQAEGINNCSNYAPPQIMMGE